jgi:deazaflavin-dependent oxidoreductase (nitroreductase family)
MARFELPEEIRLRNEAIKSNPQMTEGMGPVHLLSVPGRKSGVLRSTPVSVLEHDGQRWLVAGFADADWVKNIRIVGWAILTKGKRSERIKVVELPPQESAPILQGFVQRIRGGRFAFPIGPDEPLEAFIAAAPDYPVFRIMAATSANSIEEAAALN